MSRLIYFISEIFFLLTEATAGLATMTDFLGLMDKGEFHIPITSAIAARELIVIVPLSRSSPLVSSSPRSLSRSLSIQ